MRISQIEPSQNLLCLMPCRSSLRKPLIKNENMKDYMRSFDETQSKMFQPKTLSVVNMSIYNLKNTYKDKRKIKDAVTVKQVKLFSKENLQIKKILSFINCSQKSSVVEPTGCEYKRKSVEKPQLEIVSRKAYPYLDIVPGVTGSRTFTTPFSPSKGQKRNNLKLQKIQKQNQISQSIFQTKSLIANSKSEALINVKLKSYLNSIREGRKLHQLTQQFGKQSKKKNLRVRIKRGNNSELIKWLFKKRWWWLIDQEKDGKQKCRYNFIWTQLKQKSFFESLSSKQLTQSYEPQNFSAHNHFPQNQYLGNKKALFYNMSHYYKSKGIDVFDKLPLTFHVVSLQDESWKKFTEKFKQFKQEGRNNIWILKPGENSNRGRGITVHQSYEQIKSIVGLEQNIVEGNDSQPFKRTYIIQSYIDKPFLYNKRKFDIRSYMLLVNINKTIKGYWYSEGYIRTSSFEFQLNDFNSFVHLTNDAIQNHSQSYGKFEQGNKISYAQFQKYLDIKHVGCGYNFEKQIVSKMKQIATDSMKASAQIVKGQKGDKPVFQIFGLDFMIDKNFKPWLIQINTNPCIQTSCLVLEKVIPRMLDDALKLSLDLLFPPPQNWPASRKHCLPSPQNKFELVYQESKQQNHSLNLAELPSLGIITEDGQVYDEKQNNQFV